MFLFQNILLLLTNYNYNIKLEYKELDGFDIMCNCNICYLTRKYISPILNFIFFELEIKKVK